MNFDPVKKEVRSLVVSAEGTPPVRLPVPTENQIMKVVEDSLPFRGWKFDRLFKAVRAEVWSWYPEMSWEVMEDWMKIDFVKKVLSLLTHLSYFRRKDVMLKYRSLAADRATARIDGFQDYWFRVNCKTMTTANQEGPR